MNIELLRRIQAAIVERPEQFYMGSWFASMTYLGRKPKNCGTAGCIAGWAITLADDKNIIDGQYSLLEGCGRQRDIQMYPEVYANEALGISDEQSTRLYVVEAWPKKYFNAYVEAERNHDSQKAACVAAARIEHYINTNGKE